MSDPNAIYKAKFRELTELLGRTPVSSDTGWVALHEEYKKAWGPSEETVFAPKARERESWTNMTTEATSTAEHGMSAPGTGPQNLGTMVPVLSVTPNARHQSDRAAGPQETGFSRELAPQARTEGEGSAREGGQGDREALSGPGVNQNGVGAGTALGWGNGALRDYQRAGRGSGGGVLAVCEACGQEWEREKRRGRPNARCEGCR